MLATPVNFVILITVLVVTLAQYNISSLCHILRFSSVCSALHIANLQVATHNILLLMH